MVARIEAPGHGGGLRIAAGFASEAGRREQNQDFVAMVVPRGSALDARGAVAAVADGVASGRGGREAAEVAVRSFLDAYYGLPTTIGPAVAADRALEAVNGWLHAQSRSGGSLAGAATTFSAVILRGREAWTLHVGDSRIYHLRGDALQQLTHDHVVDHPDLRHALTRALGRDSALAVDHARQPLEVRDRLLVCSDGVHGPLGRRRLASLLGEPAGPEETARRLVAEALARGGRDNATALVLDVLSLPPPDRLAIERDLAELPIAPLPRAGETVDGFLLERLLSDGRASRLFVARDLERGERVVVKLPHPRLAERASQRAAFAREAWVAANVGSPLVAEVRPPDAARASRLYSVMPYYEGETLERRLRRAPPVSLAEGVEIGIALAKALHALHRRGIVHRDVKPENALLVDGGGLRLLDLGVARLAGFPEAEGEAVPGTPSYMAPELFEGARGDERSDVFALGVTLFRTFTGGAFPYGEIEPFQRPRFGRPRPLARWRPDLPAWLEAALARAVAPDPAERFADPMELAFDLEAGLSGGGRVVSRFVPAAPRDPERFWRIAALLLGAALLVTLLLVADSRGAGRSEGPAYGGAVVAER